MNYIVYCLITQRSSYYKKWWYNTITSNVDNMQAHYFCIMITLGTFHFQTHPKLWISRLLPTSWIFCQNPFKKSFLHFHFFAGAFEKRFLFYLPMVVDSCAHWAPVFDWLYIVKTVEISSRNNKLKCTHIAYGYKCQILIPHIMQYQNFKCKINKYNR